MNILPLWHEGMRMRHFAADSFKTRVGVIAIVRPHGPIFRIECPVRHPPWMRAIRISGTFWLVDIVANCAEWNVLIDQHQHIGEFADQI